MAWCRGKITRDDKAKALGFGAPTAAPYSDLILRGAGILFFPKLRSVVFRRTSWNGSTSLLPTKRKPFCTTTLR
jgi:hypothetical protein